jgi:ABC-type nitrate/sulfonate/bicarbonate transport system permease component
MPDMSHVHRWTVPAGRAAIISVVALAWELSGRLKWVDPDLLPPLSKVLTVLWRLLHDDSFLADLRVTALECLVAFAIVTPLALGVGFLIGESRRLERMLGPALQILLTVPKSIFLPVFVLMLGIGFAQKVVFAVAIAFFIVVPTGIAAVHSIPRALVTAVHSFGATRGQIYGRLYLPAMAPLIMGGVRLGLIFTVHGVIFAEMYGATEGIGRSILLWAEQFQMDYLFAAVLLVVVLTIILNELMQLCESMIRARFNAEATS